MSIREILQHPNPRLREVAQPIDMADPVQRILAHDVVTDLVDTFNSEPRAIGLAATQLGIPHRVIVVDITRKGVDRYVMINPVIVSRTAQSQRVNDGCLSVERGRHRAGTKRPLGLVVEWIQPDGSSRKQKFRNLIAACIHHEIDHLDGRLFIDPPEAAA